MRHRGLGVDGGWRDGWTNRDSAKRWALKARIWTTTHSSCYGVGRTAGVEARSTGQSPESGRRWLNGSETGIGRLRARISAVSCFSRRGKTSAAARRRWSSMRPSTASPRSATSSADPAPADATRPAVHFGGGTLRGNAKYRPRAANFGGGRRGPHARRRRGSRPGQRARKRNEKIDVESAEASTERRQNRSTCSSSLLIKPPRVSAPCPPKRAVRTMGLPPPRLAGLPPPVGSRCSHGSGSERARCRSTNSCKRAREPEARSHPMLRKTLSTAYRGVGCVWRRVRLACSGIAASSVSIAHVCGGVWMCSLHVPPHQIRSPQLGSIGVGLGSIWRRSEVDPGRIRHRYKVEIPNARLQRNLRRRLLAEFTSDHH